jgi:hypothetical protein
VLRQASQTQNAPTHKSCVTHDPQIERMYDEIDVKKLARPTIPKPDPDPLGFFAALHVKLKEAYDAQLQDFARQKSSWSGSVRPCSKASSMRERRRDGPRPSAPRSPSTRAMHRDLLAWMAH